MKKTITFAVFISFLICTNCQTKKEEQTAPHPVEETTNAPEEPLHMQEEAEREIEEYFLSPDHKTNTIALDIDGDGQTDQVEIVKSSSSGLYAIVVKRGNGTMDIIGPLSGSTHRVLPFDMEDLTWAQDVSVQEKNTVIYEVTDEDGDLRAEEDVPDDEKSILPYESLHLSVPESCGSGLLYWLDGTYHWHQTS
ncbi:MULTISPECIES: hypothetical protein [unclassified Myroides]|uniref:hypothetical protein n=1 Tax=unclassified Myroides TaxID=2642485 RepID=UPI003D2F6421